MKVKKILLTKDGDIITIEKTDNIINAMKKLIEKKISCLPVIENDNLIGIISDKDIFKAVYEHQDSFATYKVSDFMSSKLIVGVEDDDIEYISKLMTKNKIRHIPIVNKKTLVGLISIGDVVKSRESDMAFENRYLHIYIDGTYPG